VGTVLAVRALVLVHRRPGTIPNLLLERFPQDAIREHNDVQWVALESDPAIGVPNLLEFFLQNCVDGPREVTIKLRAKGVALVLPDKVTARLGPCEVKKLVVPVRPAPGATGSVDINIVFAATGEWGRRVRMVHAEKSESPNSGLVRALTALSTGVIVWGGGDYFPFTIHPVSEALAAELPNETRVTLLWSPAQTAQP
jgi:hypothetical protein